MKSHDYLVLAGIIVLGAVLRFWQLDLKPLWPDEIITALFSLGQTYNDVPLNVVFPLDRWQQIFTLQPATTCPQIAQAVADQSVHPPLFFCLMHYWLGWLSESAYPLAWQLRALPTLIGVSAIAAIYCLNRIAFSPAAGLMAAAVMAVSPFAVYLSQEARHYTLPMLLIIMALVGVIRIQQDLDQRPPSPLTWLGWMVVNSVGFYVHYFFILPFVAQVVILTGLLRQRPLPHRYWGIAALTGVVLSYLPWLPTLLGHFSRPETDWLKLPGGLESIAPLYQMLGGWVIMAIALPVESQPPWITIPAALLMILFAAWLAWQVGQGIKRLWRTPETQGATLTLVSFTLCVLLQFLGIVYILGKDITVAPRYNFTYYPSLCALFGASLVNLPSKYSSQTHPRPAPRQIQAVVLLVGLLSCIFVVSDLAFQKPFSPQQVAQDISQEPLPLAVMVGYDTFQDVALGLSYALEISKRYPHEGQSEVSFGFFRLGPSWKLPQLEPAKDPQPDQAISRAAPAMGPLNLWVISPRRTQANFPVQLSLSRQFSAGNGTRCTLDKHQFHRALGVPYQLYNCNRA